MAELPTRITKRAIQAAQAAFERRILEAAQTIDGLPLDAIPIAREISRNQLNRVPRLWLYAVQVELRADGVLVVTGLRTQQYRRAVGELFSQTRTYTRVNDGLQVGQEQGVTLPDGTIRIPDVQVFELTDDLDDPELVIALFNLEVHHLWIPGIIHNARTYLKDESSIDRVGFVKFFPPSEAALEHDNHVRVPALAVVFRRSSTNAGDIEVAQMLSFGNAPIDDRVLENFEHPPDGLDRFQPNRDTHRNSAAWLPEVLNFETLVNELQDLCLQQERGLWEIEMPRGLPPVQVDLLDLFVDAMLGWRVDPTGGVHASRFLVSLAS